MSKFRDAKAECDQGHDHTATGRFSRTLSEPDLDTRNRRPLFAMFTAATISQIGNQCTLVAIPRYVLVTTGSATKTGLVGVATIVPILFAT